MVCTQEKKPRRANKVPHVKKTDSRSEGCMFESHQSHYYYGRLSTVKKNNEMKTNSKSSI